MVAEGGVFRTLWLGGRLRIPLSLQTDGIGGFNPVVLKSLQRNMGAGMVARNGWWALEQHRCGV
jgi:hypothetical protein